MFDKKLGEKFRIEVKDKLPSSYVARFTKDGLETITILGDWRKSNSLLVELLTGRAVITCKWGVNSVMDG